MSHDLYRQKQNLYWKTKIDDSRGSPGRLWRTLSGVLGRDRSNQTLPKNLTANDFSRAFIDKINRVRQSTSSASGPRFETSGCACALLRFKPVGVDYITRLIKSSPNKNCSLDPLPTWMIKQYSSELARFVTFLANSSLEQGLFPLTQKNAIITPILKKPNLDPLNAGNYRPISNLNNVSKISERVFLSRLQPHITTSTNFNPLQSAYRKHHSTETALLNTLDHIYSSADHSQPTVLVSLDLSAAFDTIDHDTLICRLHSDFGVAGAALNWIHSYLTNRSQSVTIGHCHSPDQTLSSSVPQG